MLIPTFAILGVLEGGSDIMTMAGDPAWVEQLAKDHPRPAPADLAFLDQMVVWVRYGFLAALLAVLAARAARWRWERRRGVLRMTYPSGRVVQIVRGVSVLEASRLGRHPPRLGVRRARALLDVPRPRRLRDSTAVPAPSADERRVLERVAAAPGVRLACQSARGATVRGPAAAAGPTAPARSLVAPRLPRRAASRRSRSSSPICAPSPRSPSSKLPYDVVFLLNRYFEAMGAAVEAGGRPSSTSSSATA